MHAAVIELDPLADAVGAAAQNHDLPPGGGIGLAFLFVGRVQIGRRGRELCGAGVHALVDRVQAELAPPAAHVMLLARHQMPDAGIGKSLAFQRPQPWELQAVEALLAQPCLLPDQVLDLRQEPGIDLGGVERLLERPAGPKRVSDVQDPGRAGPPKLVREPVARLLVQRQGELLVESVVAELQAPERLLKGFLEAAADGHGLAHRLHLGGETGVGARELLEGEARDLGDHVIDGRLEGRRRAAPRDLVLELIERVAHRELGGDLGDGEPGGLGGQRRGARHARIHLDHQHPSVVRIDRELHVGAAGVHADLAQHGDRGVAQTLILAVGQRLGGRHGDGIAGMNPHRIHILDGAHDDAVVVAVADHLHLVFFPTDHRFLEEHLVGRRGV